MAIWYVRTMNDSYSIEEILVAIKDLQKDKKIKILKTNPKKIDNSDIPKNTLTLIEEAEKGIS